MQRFPPRGANHRLNQVEQRRVESIGIRVVLRHEIGGSLRCLFVAIKGFFQGTNVVNSVEAYFKEPASLRRLLKV